MADPYFTVALKPDAPEFTDLDAATAAANDLAKANVGKVVTVYEARKEALAPAPDVQDSDITEV